MEGTSLVTQTKALLKRNVRLKRSELRVTITELLYPIFMTLVCILMYKLLLPKNLPPVTSFRNYNLDGTSVFNIPSNTTLLVSPNSPFIKQIMDDMLVLMRDRGIKYQLYDTAEETEELYLRNINISAIGIIFQNGDFNSFINYTIRIKSEESVNPEIIQDNDRLCRTPNFAVDYTCTSVNYLRSGFIELQRCLDAILLQKLGNGVSASLSDVYLQIMPKHEHKGDYTLTQLLTVIYLSIAFTGFIASLTSHLVTEKEKKIKEAMLVIGLRDNAFWLSWSLVYGLMILLTSACMTAILAGANLFPNSNIFIVFIILFFYGLSIISLSFFISSFFSSAKIASFVASICNIIFSCMYLMIRFTRENSGSVEGPVSAIPVWGQVLVCLMCPAAFALSIDQAVFLDVAYPRGLKMSTLDVGQFPLLASMAMLIIDIILFGFLAMYFERVWPNEFGHRDPPWFCLMPSYWRRRKLNSPVTYLADIEMDDSYHEPVASHYLEKNVIRISDIHKTFKTGKKVTKAIDGLTLNIYEGQITCLLGHNGAGKTTLFNILTGSCAPEKGSAFIYGLDVTDSRDIRKIRQMTGFCPQHSILFNELTTKEHLEFYGSMKGIPDDRLEDHVNDLLTEVTLNGEKSTKTEKLSGGQKRKLQVAIALIGNPKLVFLDEPTAGMDTASRRHLWTLLKDNQKDRVIILTTHFMDEADILADRKAFLKKGSLICVGSSLFLKNKFGIGYHLRMLVEPENCDIDELLAMLQAHVPGAKFERQHGREVSVVLPLEAVSCFPALFQNLEDVIDKGQMGVISCGVSMTTLEEVFLKLDYDEQTEEAEKEDEPPWPCFSRLFKSKPSDVHTLDSPIETLDPKQIDDSSVNGSSLALARFKTLVRINVINARRIPGFTFITVLFPIILVSIACFSLRMTKSGSLPSLVFKPQLYLQDEENIQLPPLAFTVNNTSYASENFIDLIRKQGITVEGVTGDINNYLYDNPIHNLALDILQVDDQYTRGDFHILFNSAALHSLPVALNLIANTLLNESGVEISARTFPWPKRGAESLEIDPNVNWASMLLGMSLLFMPAIIGQRLVYNRERKIQTQLRTSGVTVGMYFGSSFVFDLFLYLIPAVVAFVVLLMFRVKSFMYAGAVLSAAILLIFYVPLMILVAYCLSYLFTKRRTAETFFQNIILWAAFIPYVIMANVDKGGVLYLVLHIVFCFVDPPYILLGGLYMIQRIYFLSPLEFGPGAGIPISFYFKWNNGILFCYIAPIFQVIVLFYILRYLEMKKTSGGLRSAIGCSFAEKHTWRNIKEVNNDIPIEEDEDVKAERNRVNDWQLGQTSQDPSVLVWGLRKEFKSAKKKKKIAVHNNSFLVKGGEVFGLLGPNGAGKTTTINMIMAEEQPTLGKVFISGLELSSCMSKAMQYIGYCPQQDALYENLSLREHIETFAILQGIADDKATPVANYFMTSLDIMSHANKQVKSLSGGTRRKLSYINSMLGNPKVVLLDEPSSGMDPKSKRFLWDTISAGFKNKNCGAILTTHYMDEAEALCSRIGIMVNGKMECLGSSQRLKSKFGSGYILEVKLFGDNLEESITKLDSYLRLTFPSTIRSESFGDRANYMVPDSSIGSLAIAFGVLENSKIKFNVEEYSFSQCTLEQVFLDFARKQVDEDD